MCVCVCVRAWLYTTVGIGLVRRIRHATVCPWVGSTTHGSGRVVLGLDPNAHNSKIGGGVQQSSCRRRRTTGCRSTSTADNFRRRSASLRGARGVRKTRPRRTRHWKSRHWKTGPRKTGPAKSYHVVNSPTNNGKTRPR